MLKNVPPRKPVMDSAAEAEAENIAQKYADNPKAVKKSGDLNDVVPAFKANHIVNEMIITLAEADSRSRAYIARTILEKAIREQTESRGLHAELAEVQSRQKG